jgi:hypothetical protein
MTDVLSYNPARDAASAFLKIEQDSHAKSMTRIEALKKIQTEIKTLTDFISLLHTNEGKDIDMTHHADLFEQVTKLMPFAFKGGEPGHFDEHALVEKIKEAKGKYDVLIQCARDQVNNRNMEMSPETAQLDNLLKTLKEISDIMGRLIDSYSKSGETMTKNQRV